MISNWNSKTEKWEKITFSQFLKQCAEEKIDIAIELTKETWKQKKPELVKYGFAHEDSEIKFGKGSLVHFASN